MSLKTYSVLFFLISSTMLTAQNSENRETASIGVSLIKFSNEDAKYIGDRYLLQVPRVNFSKYLFYGITLDASIEFTSFSNLVVIQNRVRYFSISGAILYDFNRSTEKIIPYILVGASIVDTGRISTPTINFGGGSTWWFSESWGVKSEVIYKYSLESFESMRSHFQFSTGIVYSFGF